MVVKTASWHRKSLIIDNVTNEGVLTTGTTGDWTVLSNRGMRTKVRYVLRAQIAPRIIHTY